MRQSEMNIRELMHKTGVDRMHVTLINDEPHPALIAFADELEVHWKKLVGNQAERISDLEASPISEEVIDILRSKIKALESEILDQCRLNGMGAEREATLLGKVERQSAALKLAREALFDMQDSYAAVHGWKDSFVIAATTAIAAIDALGEVK